MMLGIMGVIAVLAILPRWTFFGKETYWKKTVFWELETPVVYDGQLQKKLADMQEAELPCVLWTENENAMVENPEFVRSVQVRTMGIAGNSGVLFQGGNVLGDGETGYCLLGTDTAYALFGSTEIAGCEVRINGKLYQAAGIEFQEKNLCVYELSQEDGQTAEYAAFTYKDTDFRRITEQKVQNMYGIYGKEIKNPLHSEEKPLR